MKSLSMEFHYWVFSSFTPTGSITNWCSKFLIIHHIDFCTSSYLGVGDPRCSINFREDPKISDNSVSNSMIHLSRLTHQISSSNSKIATSIVLENVEFKQLPWSILIFFEDPLSSYLSFRTVVPSICAEVSWICELATLFKQLVYLEDEQN